MNTNPIDNFFEANTPQAIGLISILLVILAFLKIKRLTEKGHAPPLIQKVLFWFRLFADNCNNYFQALPDELLKFIPPIIKKTLSPENNRLKDFISVNHKSISYAYVVIILILYVKASSHLGHNRFLRLSIFVLLVFTYHLLRKLLVFLTGNQIFQVCPRCGYTNKTISDHCSYCCNKGSSVIDVKEPTILLEEISEYKNAGACNEIPLSILNGLRLSSDEVALIFFRCNPISKNGIKRIYDTNGLPCLLNRLCLTNKRIYFIASLFGGWRAIDSYQFESITQYSTGTRTSADPFKPIGEAFQCDIIESLTIKTIDGNEYRLKGYRPEKLYLSVVNCLNKRKEKLKISRQQASNLLSPNIGVPKW
jgi:hypothetical protein